MAKVVYLAGPMSGIPYFNFPQFFAYQALLECKGYQVWSPAQNDIGKHGRFYELCPTGSHDELVATGVKLSYRTALKDDLAFIMERAEAIALMPGWEKSKGAAVEHALAVCLGLEIIELEKLQ